MTQFAYYFDIREHVQSVWNNDNLWKLILSSNDFYHIKHDQMYNIMNENTKPDWSINDDLRTVSSSVIIKINS
jgi:hypothetical protein